MVRPQLATLKGYGSKCYSKSGMAYCDNGYMELVFKQVMYDIAIKDIAINDLSAVSVTAHGRLVADGWLWNSFNIHTPSSVFTTIALNVAMSPYYNEMRELARC